jgi:hypothetical protein
MKKNKNSLAEMIMLSNSTHNLRISDYIIKLTCKYYNVEEGLMKQKTRKREICFPRQVAMYLIKDSTNLSLKSIGDLFNGKDHATVLHSFRTVNNIIDTDKQVKADVKKLKKTIGLKSKSLKNNIELDIDFYHINFNNYLSIKIEGNKGIMLTGYSSDEMHDFIHSIKENIIGYRMHEDTGFYILEEKRNNDSNI